MPIYSSSSDSDDDRRPARPFGRERPIRDVLGGGKVSDVLLWRDKRVSAAILIAISTIWFLFEVVEYNLLTLLCHIVITAMLVLFIWYKGADMFSWPLPAIPDVFLDEITFSEYVTIWHKKFNDFLKAFYPVACGSDFKLFILTIVSLWILSVIGNYIDTLNLLFLGCLCLETLPYMYEQYENEVDRLIERVSRPMRKSYRKFDSEFLRKIPRGPIKAKKTR